MAGWQDISLKCRIAKGEAWVRSNIAELEGKIKRTDKRTRNSKMSVIFLRADLIVAKDALAILTGGETIGTYKEDVLV